MNDYVTCSICGQRVRREEIENRTHVCSGSTLKKITANFFSEHG